MAGPPPDDGPDPGDRPSSPLTGWSRAGAEGETPADLELEATPATGWVIAGSRPPADPAQRSAGPSVPAGGAPAGPGPPARWPQAATIPWAQAAAPPGTASPTRRGARPPADAVRRRTLLMGSLAAVVLAMLLVASGALGFAAGALPAPTPTPWPLPTLLPTVGPIGSVDSPLIRLRLPAGWLEQQQSGTDVKLVDFPNGYIDINLQSTTAVGASTPGAVLQKAEQGIRSAPSTIGLPSTCVQPVAHTIAGRPGLEQGFQFQERSSDGKTLFTNCAVDWASVRNGEVYFWEVFNTLDQLKASTAAAALMQRSAQWLE